MFINYELLRTLFEVGRSRTFAEAARRLRVTPSAVSHQLRTLQGQLDVALFERVGRRAQLTPAASALVQELGASFGRIDDAIAAATSDARDVRGRVRLGGPGPFSRMWLHPRLVALFGAYPELVIDVRFDIPSVLSRALEDGELDLAIIAQGIDAPGLTLRPIHIEEFVAVASPRRFKGKRRPETARELGEHPFVVFDDDLAMHAAYWRAVFGHREPLPRKVICRVTSLDEMLALAVDGVAIAVLPDYFVADALARGSVVPVGPRDSGVKPGVGPRDSGVKPGAGPRDSGVKPGAAGPRDSGVKPGAAGPRDGGPRRRGARNTLYLAWRKSVVETARFRVVRDALITTLANG